MASQPIRAEIVDVKPDLSACCLSFSGYISQTVVGDKEVFLEFAEMVNDVNLE
jgi:hypothetical protein